MRFEGKVVMVTGGARGIGLATALGAASEGAQVIICDLDQAAIDEATAQIGQAAAGGRGAGLVMDVSDSAQVGEGVAKIIADFGRIDVLVNNAAYIQGGAAIGLDEAYWRKVLDVSLTGSFLCAQAVAEAWMIPNRSGAIVNLGSGAALAAIPNCPAYVSAKHGIIGLTKALAVDWGQYNVRVNCVCPGLTFTEAVQRIRENKPEVMAERERRIPMGRGAEASDIANAILFLASAEADAISGHALNVDGGMLAISPGYTAPRDGG